MPGGKRSPRRHPHGAPGAVSRSFRVTRRGRSGDRADPPEGGAIAHIKLTRCRNGINSPVSTTSSVTPVTGPCACRVCRNYGSRDANKRQPRACSSFAPGQGCTAPLLSSTCGTSPPGGTHGLSGGGGAGGARGVDGSGRGVRYAVRFRGLLQGETLQPVADPAPAGRVAVASGSRQMCAQQGARRMPRGLRSRRHGDHLLPAEVLAQRHPVKTPRTRTALPQRARGPPGEPADATRRARTLSDADPSVVRS